MRYKDFPELNDLIVADYYKEILMMPLSHSKCVYINENWRLWECDAFTLRLQHKEIILTSAGFYRLHWNPVLTLKVRRDL